jgi:general transcription factor 3C polypeptide 5 (transcription factor C subunit 1)
MKVKAKRSYCNYLLPYKSSPSCRPKTAVITKENLEPEKTEEKQSEDKAYNDNIYVFHSGTVPPSRQMFYQVCDVIHTYIHTYMAQQHSLLAVFYKTKINKNLLLNRRE